MNYEFVITTPIKVCESLGVNKMRLAGTFIKLNFPTKNGRIYQVQESEKIASDLVGKAVYYGVDEKGIHINKDENLIGKVVNTFVDKVKNVIGGVVEVWNTDQFPYLLNIVRKGWGFSIGGIVENFLHTGKYNYKMMPILKCVGMRANHLQLLQPSERKADPTANVSQIIPVMESMLITPDPYRRDRKEILEIIIIDDVRT